jgi:membrane protease YdiL (CAAX protease family)
MNFLGLHVLTWALLVFLAVVVPILGRIDMRALRRALDRGEANARLDTYERTILFLWGFSLLMATLWILAGRGLADLGLVPGFGPWQIFFAGLALAATAAFVMQVARTTRDAGQLREVRDQLGEIARIAPHTDRELSRFGWLSLTAGICEEFLYRGLLMTLLAGAFGAWPAILISSLVFGLGHAYQGPGGILRTGAVGLVLALVVTLTGSLFVAMIAHAAIDIAQGRMLRAAVNAPDEDARAVPDAA